MKKLCHPVFPALTFWKGLPLFFGNQCQCNDYSVSTRFACHFQWWKMSRCKALRLLLVCVRYKPSVHWGRESPHHIQSKKQIPQPSREPWQLSVHNACCSLAYWNWWLVGRAPNLVDHRKLCKLLIIECTSYMALEWLVRLTQIVLLIFAYAAQQFSLQGRDYVCEPYVSGCDYPRFHKYHSGF